MRHLPIVQEFRSIVGPGRLSHIQAATKKRFVLSLQSPYESVYAELLVLAAT